MKYWLTCDYVNNGWYVVTLWVGSQPPRFYGWRWGMPPPNPACLWRKSVRFHQTGDGLLPSPGTGWGVKAVWDRSAPGPKPDLTLRFEKVREI